MRPHELVQQLEDDVGLVRELLELADAEFAALTERQLERLESILGHKQPLLAQLGQHAALRGQLLRAQNLPADRNGLAQLAGLGEQREQVLQLADRLSELLSDCQARNERNGRLIRANRQAVGGMLRALRGDSDFPGVYDSRGVTSQHSRHRPLSEA